MNTSHTNFKKMCFCASFFISATLVGVAATQQSASLEHSYSQINSYISQVNKPSAERKFEFEYYVEQSEKTLMATGLSSDKLKYTVSYYDKQPANDSNKLMHSSIAQGRDLSKDLNHISIYGCDTQRVCDALDIMNLNEQQKISFIFYHEYALTLIDKVSNVSQDTHLLFNQSDNTGKFNKTFLTEQYRQTFADVFTLNLMSQQFPELSVPEQSKILAGFRGWENILQDHGNGTHTTQYGILSQNNDKNANIYGIIDKSLSAAYKNVEVYSELHASSNKTLSPDAHHLETQSTMAVQEYKRAKSKI